MSLLWSGFDSFSYLKIIKTNALGGRHLEATDQLLVPGEAESACCCSKQVCASCGLPRIVLSQIFFWF